MGKQWKQWQIFFWGGAPKALQMVTAAMKLKDACSLEEKLWQTYTAYLKADITLPTKVHIVKAMVFPVVMYRCETSTLTQKSLIRVRLFVTPWIAAYQVSLSITNSRSSPKLMSIESVIPSSHLILCHPLLPPSIFPSIRVISNELVLHIRWPKYWSFSIGPSNEYSGLISFRKDWLDLLAD